MFDFEVSHIGRRNAKEHIKGINGHNTINLVISGVKYRKIYGKEFHNPKPMFLIGVKGEPYDTVFTDKRENWYIALEKIEFKLDQSKEYVCIVGAEEIKFQAITYLPEEHIFTWHNEMRKIHAASQEPTPLSNFRVKLGIFKIFSYIIDCMQKTERITAAGKFKERIDDDKLFQKDFHQLAVECGYSLDHLRLLFIKEFGICPKDYRNQKKCAEAMNYITNSNILVKEISSMLGFKNESAFSAMFKRMTGQSPEKAILKFRGKF